MANRAVFLDRDGTINVEKNYLYKVEEFEWIDGAVDAIRLINQSGFMVIVITNQAGIARGLYSERDVEILHSHIDSELSKAGARIDAYYYCPHHPSFGPRCECRKPEAGLFIRARDEFDIDMPRSWMIGDKRSDIFGAINAGVSPMLVLTGHGARESDFVAEEVVREQSILPAVHRIIGK